RNKNFAVTNLSGLGGLEDRFHDTLSHFIRDHDFKFHLWQKVDGVLAAAINFAVAFLPAEPAHLAQSHSFDADGSERIFHRFGFEWLDNGLDFFHRDHSRTRVVKRKQMGFIHQSSTSFADVGAHDETRLRSAELNARERRSIDGNETGRLRTNRPPRDIVRETNCVRIRTIRRLESWCLLPTSAFRHPLMRLEVSPSLRFPSRKTASASRTRDVKARGLHQILP